MVKSSIIDGLIFLAIGLAAIFIFKALNIGGLKIISDVKALANDYDILDIFFATILDGAVVPLGSPALVVAAASLGICPIPLVAAATVGSTISMIINYYLACRPRRLFVNKRLGTEKLEEVTVLCNLWGLDSLHAFLASFHFCQ